VCSAAEIVTFVRVASAKFYGEGARGNRHGFAGFRRMQIGRLTAQDAQNVILERKGLQTGWSEHREFVIPPELVEQCGPGKRGGPSAPCGLAGKRGNYILGLVRWSEAGEPCIRRGRGAGLACYGRARDCGELGGSVLHGIAKARDHHRILLKRQAAVRFQHFRCCGGESAFAESFYGA